MIKRVTKFQIEKRGLNITHSAWKPSQVRAQGLSLWNFSLLRHPEAKTATQWILAPPTGQDMGSLHFQMLSSHISVVSSSILALQSQLEPTSPKHRDPAHPWPCPPFPSPACSGAHSQLQKSKKRDSSQVFNELDVHTECCLIKGLIDIPLNTMQNSHQT